MLNKSDIYTGVFPEKSGLGERERESAVLPAQIIEG